MEECDFLAKKNKLSIYLLKPEISKKEEIFESPAEIHEFQNYGDGSVAYYVPSSVHKPSWLESFFHKRNISDLLQANSRVVLIKRLTIDDEERNFALTFGYARSLFKEDVLEEQFGLKIVLNSIKTDQIRRISKSSVGSNHKQSDEQLPKNSDITEFGFDINRDLMKNVSGKSTDEIFEESILTGGDIFSLTVERDVDNIDDFLIFCYRRYKSTSYRTGFAWIDNIKYVKNKATINKLNEELIKEIKLKHFESVWMAVPDVVSWVDIKDFKISGDKEPYSDIYIEKVIESLRNDLVNVSQLQSKRIYARSSRDDNDNAYEWSAYKCIIAEITMDEQQYCLNNGKWYKIDNSFVNKIHEQYSQIALCDDDFVDCFGESEDDYNDNLLSSLSDAHLLHKYKIAIGGGRGNNIEPCDLLWNKKLIHVKKNGGSSVLSHLFNQATVSGEMWLDTEFRKQLREKMEQNGEGDCIPEPFKSSDYEVVIAIINKFSEERPKIPFFSEVALCFTSTNLHNLGYKLKLKNINLKEK